MSDFSLGSKMVSKKSSVPPLNTFIVRFWRDPDGSVYRWRGQIQHIQTGEQLSFVQGNVMLTFIQQWVKIMENDKSITGDVADAVPGA